MNSRAKGARGERELAAKLREHGFINAKRGQQYSGAAGNADVIDALPGVHIECKRVERLNLYDAMAQSMHDARRGEMPVVMHRKNDCAWLCTMRLDDFIELYKNGGQDEGI